MLEKYRTDTNDLLMAPAAPTSRLYPIPSLDRWINRARGQLAGKSEGIRYLASIDTVVGQRGYSFAALNTGVPATTGIAGIIHIRRIALSIENGGQRWLDPRQWEWFELYCLNNPVPTSGPPRTWAQYGQGSAGTRTGSGASGSFQLDPPPDDVYTLLCDCVCYPIDLVDDATIEAIPYLWTDAVPFFAAYYALLSAQTGARQADADRMMQRYEEFVERARISANPSVLRYMYQQAGDPTQSNKVGASQGAGGV